MSFTLDLLIYIMNQHVLCQSLRLVDVYQSITKAPLTLVGRVNRPKGSEVACSDSVRALAGDQLGRRPFPIAYCN